MNSLKTVVVPEGANVGRPPKFTTEDIVEQTNLGDLPFMIVEVRPGYINRYDLSGIDGSTYSNIPEYMMVKARPSNESKWGEQ